MLPYDGLNPLPPQYCYLKPHYLDVQTQLLRPRRARCAMSSLDRILPFLKPIEDLLLRSDRHRGDGQRRRPARVRRARRHARSACPDRTLETRNLTVAIKNIARACGDEISEAQPHPRRAPRGRLARRRDVSAMCRRRPGADDPEVHASVQPGRPGRRRHADARDGASSSRARSRPQQNILISGGTGTGKTTLLNALAARIPDDDRIVVIEETSEIHLNKPNLVRFEARRAQMPLGQEPPLPAVTIADLLRATLAASARPHSRRRGARARGVRPAAGAQHRPPGQPQHHPRELGRAGADAVGALRADRQRRPAAREHRARPSPLP